MNLPFGSDEARAARLPRPVKEPEAASECTVASAWLVYVLVDDIQGVQPTSSTLGAQVMKDIIEVPGIGWFSIILDPTGAALACWEK